MSAPRAARAASRRGLGVVATVAALAIVSPAATAAPRAGQTAVVSASSAGEVANDYASEPAVSDDGRYVAFVSYAPNLVAGNTNRGCSFQSPTSWTGYCRDVYVRDRDSGKLTRVSVAGDGAQSNSWSRNPSISQDGRYVAFVSQADNLVPGDTNRNPDVFVHDRDADEDLRFDEAGAVTTERVSVTSDGGQIEREIFSGQSAPHNVSACDRSFCTRPTVSPDGRYVAFATTAPQLRPRHPSDGRRFDVFLHDRELRTTELVSVGADGGPADGHSFVWGYPTAVSAGGRYVAFYSAATNLVAGDGNGRHDVFVRDRQQSRTVRVSLAADGTEALFANASYASLSADGRFVAFRSSAHELVPTTTNSCVGNPSLRVQEGTRVRATKACADVFVRDRDLDGDGVFDEPGGVATERVSVAGDGTQSDGDSDHPAISGDGRYVAFASWAANLLTGAAPAPGEPAVDRRDHRQHVFVHDRLTGHTDQASLTSDGVPSDAVVSSQPSVGGDGRVVGFTSDALNLVGDGAFDGRWSLVFARDRGPDAGVVQLAASPADDGVAISGQVTFSGAVVAAASDAADDGLAGSDLAGGELRAASLTYRPERNDLLVRLDVATLLSVNARGVNTGIVGAGSVGGAPATVYAFTVTVAGTRWEVRATAPVDRGPLFELYRCAPLCMRDRELPGSYGTTGHHVRVVVPLDALGAAEGELLGAIRASTRPAAAAQAAADWDVVDLGDAAVPRRTLAAGVAPAGTPVEDVDFDFDLSAASSHPAFAAILDAAHLSPGETDVWTRACLGEDCGSAVARVILPPRPGDG